MRALSLAACALLVCLGSCLVACRPKPAAGVRTIAILPFENLTSGREYDWLSAAGPAILDYQAFGQKDMAAFSAPTVNDAVAKHANEYLHTRFRISGGELVVESAVENAQSHTITPLAAIRVTASTDGALAAVNRLAGMLVAHARPVHVRSSAALVPYGQALQGGDPAGRANLLQQALAIAPDFAPAWLARVTLDLESHSPSAQSDIEAALRTGDALDRARLLELAAVLAGNIEGRIAALTELTRLAPAQASAWQALAELQVNRREFPGAASSWGEVARLQPWNADAFNQLGYARAWARDADGAAKALADYARLEPANPNPLDSLGEVQFFAGRYKEAEASFVQAREKAPGFLDGIDQLKAAEARLMTGDRDGATRLFAQFLTWRRNALHDPLVPLWQARWDFLIGRRRAAMTELSGALGQLSGDARARAETQYSFWLLATGDRAGAVTHAETGLQAAQSLETRLAAFVGRFLALPSAPPAEWVARANATLTRLPPGLRVAALGYALALDGHAKEAIPLLQRVYESATPGDDGEQRAMLAPALMAAGRQEEARKLLWPVPIPLTSDDSTFAALVFPRWLAWSGHDAQFRQYSGDLHLVFE